MSEIGELKEEIEKIKERNRRVEKDKEGETSFVRRLKITFLTYIIVLIYCLIIKVDRPFISALVPPLAYLVSTVTFGFLKSKWLRNRR